MVPLHTRNAPFCLSVSAPPPGWLQRASRALSAGSRALSAGSRGLSAGIRALPAGPETLLAGSRVGCGEMSRESLIVSADVFFDGLYI